MGYELTTGAGLLGRWGMNEGTGTTTTADSVGTNTGTLAASPTWLSPGFPSTQNAAPVLERVIDEVRHQAVPTEGDGRDIDATRHRQRNDDTLSVSVSSVTRTATRSPVTTSGGRTGVDIAGSDETPA